MNIKVVSDTISKEDVAEIAQEFYLTMIKGVADLEKEIIAIGGEYHIDANSVLIEQGSRQENLWGFNVHLNKDRDSWLEYSSLINIRPAVNNRSMFIENQEICDKIKEIVNKRII